MKKLLSLLSVVTITGTAFPTTIAASSYQKQQTIKNSDVNYQQANNLENLTRVKRENDGQLDQKIVIRSNSVVASSGLVLNNKVYFGSNDHNVYEYDPATGQQKIVIRTNSVVAYSGVMLNNKVYFGSYDHNVYEYYEKTDLNEVITNTYLGNLNDNNDQTIIDAVKDKNNLYNLEYTIRNKTENSAEFWINDDNIHYKQWSWKKVYFTVKPDLLISSNIHNYSHNKTYYLKNWSWTAEKINNIPEIKNVLIIKTVPNSDAVYFSTENAVYYMSSNSWTANKISGIDEPISQIEIDKDNRVYFKSLFKSSEIVKIFQNNQIPKLTINITDYEGIDYRASLNNVFRYLIRERIIVPYSSAINGPGYVMNNQTGYFIVNINLIDADNNSNSRIQLVYNRTNLYIEGFVVRNGDNDNSAGRYYYFSDALL